MSWNTWVHAENEQPFLTPTTSASFLKSPFHSPSLWAAYCPCPKKVTFMKVFLLNDLLPILPVRRPVAELLLRSVNNLQRPSGRGARGAEKVKVNMFILHFFRLFSIYCQRVKVPPVKEDGAQLWRDLRASSRPLVWARHISSNKEQYFFENLLHRHNWRTIVDTSPVFLIMHVEFKVSIFFSR